MEQVEERNMKKNIRIYNFYKIFAYDILFYYAVHVLYFTKIKGLSIAELMYLSSIYFLGTMLWEMTSNYIVEGIGLRKSIILGNVLVVGMGVLYLVAPWNAFWLIALGEIIGALGYSLKSIAEGTLFYESLKKLGREKDFSKLEGKAKSKHFYVEAVTAILAGYLFLINPYIPTCLMIVMLLVALVMSFGFIDTKQEKIEHTNFKEYLKEFKGILHSKRSNSILLLAMIIHGTIIMAETLYQSILLDFGFTSEKIAYVVCAFSFVVGFGASLSDSIQKLARKRTLTLMLMSFTIALGTIGLIGYYNSSFSIWVLLGILLCLGIMGIMQGSYRVAIKKYVISFTTPVVRTKMTSLYYVGEGLGAAILSFIAGVVLDNVGNNSIACIMMCTFTLILGMMALIFSRNKLGLNPEEYKPEEINNIDITKEEE